MSFHVYSLLPSDEANPLSYDSVRIGANGSEEVLMALLLAAYAAGRWPESRRVRRWVRPRFGAPARLTSSWDRMSVRELNELLAATDDGCAWVGLVTSRDGYRPAGAVGRRPPSCPTLIALMRIYTAAITNYSEPIEGRTIAAADVPAVADAVGAVLPKLAESSWNETLRDFHGLLCRAAAGGLAVVAS